MKSIILASASPRRRFLLEHIGLRFEVRPADVKEDYEAEWSPPDIVTTLSSRKAKHVAREVDNGLVIGADTIVVYDKNVLGKPEDSRHARRMLKELSDSSHEVYTGLTLINRREGENKSRPLSFSKRTSVTFGEIDYEEIRTYVASGRPMDKAGAYGIQDPMGALFVKKICGDYHNVVGFPLHAFYVNLKSYAPEYLELLD